MNTHHVKADEAGIRLDKLMTEILPDVSRQSIQKWIKAGNITANGVTQKPNYKCNQDEMIHWYIPIEKQAEVLPEKIPLYIVYEDEALLVINKRKGMLVHPTNQVHSGTLVNALLHYTANLSNINGENRPGIVHRLDKDTSGLLVVAKNNQVHEHLKLQFQAQTVKRIYETVVYGVVQHKSGIIKAPIGRNPKNRLQMAVADEGKMAETHFEVIKYFKNYTHVACELKTGRTHQIRVHMKYMNHPIVGDELYTSKKSSLIKGQALFAKKLAFTHPISGEKMAFEIERPEEMQQLLERLEN